MNISNVVSRVDDFVWGPVMISLLVGTGLILTIRTNFLPWRNLGFALKCTLSKEARQKKNGVGDVSPFSALTTALAATIGTGNIVGVATAMVSGGPGALIWMWLSAAFGLSSKFAECMLAIKYREINQVGEMSGGPMYTIRKAFPNKELGKVLGWLFAFFTVIASFGIGNLTQANSIASALNETFRVSTKSVGIIVMILTFFIIVGGIKSISKVSSVVVPVMALFYIVCGMIVMVGNRYNILSGIKMICSMAFSVDAVSGGMLGTVVASMTDAMRYGIARGVFSNEAGMGSAAITAAAASTNHPVKQGYINMTGTFWDTMVICTMTGLCIVSSGVLGTTAQKACGIYEMHGNQMDIVTDDEHQLTKMTYEVRIHGKQVMLASKEKEIVLTPYEGNPDKVASGYAPAKFQNGRFVGSWKGNDKSVYHFREDGTFEYDEIVTGAALTILAFQTVLGPIGAWMISIGIVLFAFSTILGWEYHGEKAFEYILGTHKWNVIYRIFFSAMVYLGATQSLELVWNLSDIANAFMAIPNLICLLLLSGEIARDIKEFQKDSGIRS
ncbi:MAG: sodium:alanine symporter family protein [Eubacteriales bacterium]|nr:sodium:alanine symporter family protein [Eubacteriales bacterium]